MDREFFTRLERLYADMEMEYDNAAVQAGLSCKGCPDNCCTSYFQHHTHVEWAYLWEGLRTLPEQRLMDIRVRAADYVHAAEKLIKQQRVPDLMCPLNDEGLCILYAHRLMICRLHGVPNRFILPNGQTRAFPGCIRCQEVLAGKETTPVLDRTGFYRRLASLEMDYLRELSNRPARIRHSLAEMIHLGPPLG